MVMRRFLMVCGFLVLGCYDAPFERANPNDPYFGLTMSLSSSRDTVTPSNPYVAFLLTTNPVVEGYSLEWSASPSSILHEGDGVFRLIYVPTATFPVTVTARFQGRSAQKVIIVAPDP